MYHGGSSFYLLNDSWAYRISKDTKGRLCIAQICAKTYHAKDRQVVYC